VHFIFFVNQKTECQLKVCFSLLVNKNNEAKILIKNLYLFKNYIARKLVKEFPERVETENFKLFFKEAA